MEQRIPALTGESMPYSELTGHVMLLEAGDHNMNLHWSC